jgi:hypothetical protein
MLSTYQQDNFQVKGSKILQENNLLKISTLEDKFKASGN